MSNRDVLAFVLAGGQGSRLQALTNRRAKPAVPFAGGYRLIDFPLSNCLHSDVSDVWIVREFQRMRRRRNKAEYDDIAIGRPTSPPISPMPRRSSRPFEPAFDGDFRPESNTHRSRSDLRGYTRYTPELKQPTLINHSKSGPQRGTW